VVVVSAMAKVTDSLLAMARRPGAAIARPLLRWRAPSASATMTPRRTAGHGALHGIHSNLGADFEDLDELLRGIGAVGEITPAPTTM